MMDLKTHLFINQHRTSELKKTKVVKQRKTCSKGVKQRLNGWPKCRSN